LISKEKEEDTKAKSTIEKRIDFHSHPSQEDEDEDESGSSLNPSVRNAKKTK